MRDDFVKADKELLARRVGYRCSNPDCRKLTSGPHTSNDKYINIGVAAHITAASKGGPRYDENISSEERKSTENGIWLCQDCAKLIDSDSQRYTIELIKTWKAAAEQLALAEIQTINQKGINDKDKDLIKFYYQCFDRPAFQDEIMQEGCIEAFDKAIEDTIIALNTGVLRSRDGSILKKAEGKAFIENQIWRDKLDTIVDMLKAIRKRLIMAKKSGALEINGDKFYIFYDRNLAQWFDMTRTDIMNIFSSICEEVGIKKMKFPRNTFKW